MACAHYDNTQSGTEVESSWNVMAHGDAREGKWRGNCRMEWVASILHITSEHGVSNITIPDAHTSAASSRLNWRPRLIKWTRPFRWKMKSCFCACAITFQRQSTLLLRSLYLAAGGQLEIRVESPVCRRSVSSLPPSVGDTQVWTGCYSDRNVKVNTQVHLVSKYKSNCSHNLHSPTRRSWRGA